MSLSVSIPVNAMASDITVVPKQPEVSDIRATTEATEIIENTDQDEKLDNELNNANKFPESSSIESITDNSIDKGESVWVNDSLTVETEVDQDVLTDTVPDSAPSAETPPEAEQSPFELNGTTLVSYTGTDEEVVVPDGVTRIDKSAFKDNSTMRKVILPVPCETLLDGTFTTCSNLQEVVINSKNISFGTKVFGDAPLTVYGYPYSEARVYCEKIEDIVFAALEKLIQST